jgi:DNA-binding SARP family transcriptional activator/tetratricopeptide (TPR) repeat protein
MAGEASLRFQLAQILPFTRSGGERAFGQVGLMRFRILGPLEVLSPDGWTAISAAKWRSLLACLLVRPGRIVPNESLIFELWGDNPPSTANNMVSIYVHRLRKEVLGDTGGKVLVHRAPGYLLHVAPGDLDIQVFESLIASGRTALAAGDPKHAAAQFGEALRLWRGPLLADVLPSPLLETHVEHAAEMWLDATESRIQADLACGRAAQVVTELRGLVTEHPLRERLWALLMRGLEEAGRRAEAFETYAQAREVIAEELGVDPGSELRKRYARLLAADTLSASIEHQPSQASVIPGGVDAISQAPYDVQPNRGAAASTEAGLGSGDEPLNGANLKLPRAEPPGTIAIGTFAEYVQPAAQGAPVTEPGAPEQAEPKSPRPAQLPADIGDFTGRETHVAHLCGLLTGVDGSSSGAVRIAVVNGAGGLGKTTLAVHAAHRVREEFPDGQLYVDLLGASAQPADLGEVLARFLRDLGVEGDRVPARDDERAALYRTRLTGRRVLILLDNAQDAAQVRALLPGSSSCAVLVTTRNRTPDLVSARFVDLNVLEETEALALFSRIVGEERAVAEPDATTEVLFACAGLPLAIRICAARLAARRSWRIATLAGRLRNIHRRLDELSIGDLAVRASFQVSYGSLQPRAVGAEPARVFRLLGLWQGSWISCPAAAALVGVQEDEIVDALETLVDGNLLESPAPDWYRFHDLLRVYAIERVQEEEQEAARAEAVGRLMRWYLDTAEAAADTVSPHRYEVANEGVKQRRATASAFGSVHEALAWYDNERVNLAAATRQAAVAGLHDIAWRLPPTLFPVFNRRSNWAECVSTHLIALESVRKVGDRLGEAWVLNQLGFALARLRDTEAFGLLEQALAIRREFGDVLGEAQTYIALGEGHLNVHGPGQDALLHLRRAADLLEPMGAISLRSVALNNLGEVYFGLDDLDAAVQCYTQARDIGCQLGGYVEGHALHNLGRVFLRLHRVDEAIASLSEALRKYQAAGLLYSVALTLTELAAARVKTGDIAEANASLTRAIRVFEQMGDQAEAAKAASLLASLTAELPPRLLAVTCAAGALSGSSPNPFGLIGTQVPPGSLSSGSQSGTAKQGHEEVRMRSTITDE